MPTESWTADDGCANNGCDHDGGRWGDHDGSAVGTTPPSPIAVPTRSIAARDEDNLGRADCRGYLGYGKCDGVIKPGQ